MKKCIPLLLALLLMLGLSVTVMAEQSDTPSQEQKVTIDVPEHKIKWELVIPADVTITDGGYSNGENIGAVKINIVKDEEHNHELIDDQHIDAFLNYDGILKSGADEQLEYSLSPENAAEGQDFESYETRKKNVKVKIGTMTKSGEQYDKSTAWVGQNNWDSAVKGDYSGTITYTSEFFENAGN